MRRKEGVMIELTDKQQRELAAAGWPPRVHNPSTRETFVLLHTEMYERVRAILEAEDELDAVREMQPLVNEAIDQGERADAESRESA
jgi:hypothetical protein